jgi:hypothetical protein
MEDLFGFSVGRCNGVEIYINEGRQPIMGNAVMQDECETRLRKNVALSHKINCMTVNRCVVHPHLG